MTEINNYLYLCFLLIECWTFNFVLIVCNLYVTSAYNFVSLFFLLAWWCFLCALYLLCCTHFLVFFKIFLFKLFFNIIIIITYFIYSVCLTYFTFFNYFKEYAFCTSWGGFLIRLVFLFLINIYVCFW